MKLTLTTTNTVKIKLLLLSPLPPEGKPGGIGTWSITILEELYSKPDYEIIHFDTAVKWRSVTDKKMYKRLVGGVFHGLYTFVKTFYLSLKHKPDVMHLCSSGSLATLKDILVIMSQMILGVRTVIHYHMGRLPAIIDKGGLPWMLNKLAISLADSVVVLDKNSESVLNKFFLHKVIRIPNAINPKHFESIHKSIHSEKSPASPVSIVFIGWAIPAKGLRELINVCVNISLFNLELKIVGPIEQDFQSDLEIVAKSRDNGRWLHFIGSVEHKTSLQYMNDADIFVLPSYTEGFPYVIAEAMALGKPIITTKVGAILEMLKDDNDELYGLLIQPRNEEELREAIIYLFEHPDEAKSLGHRASIRALSLYSIKQVFKKYDSLWKDLST